MITREELKEILEYRKDGHFYWLTPTGSMKKDVPAGSYDAAGYRTIRINGELYKEHRLVWLLHYDKFSNGEIDHINQIKNDNRVENLRDVSRSQNQYNKCSAKGSSSKYIGVSWNKSANKWMARIRVNGKEKYLGSFDNEIDAAKRRDEEIIKVGCQYCALNFMRDDLK